MYIKEFLGTCASIDIGNLAETKGRKFSWKKACKMIKEYDESFYYSLALDYFNPWHYNTNIKKGNVLHITHSQIDYLFTVEP